MRLFRPADQLEMPWKDGGGVTTQIAIAPEGASVTTGFDWRLSKAQVSRSGPFSRFEGYDRHLALVKGNGMVLRVDGQIHRMDAPHLPFAFPGEADVRSDLIGGPCTDFNLMVRRAQWRSELHAIREGHRLPQAPLRLLHLIEGAMTSGAFHLAPGDTLVWETGDGMEPQGAGSSPLLAYLGCLWPV